MNCSYLNIFVHNRKDLDLNIPVNVGAEFDTNAKGYECVNVGIASKCIKRHQ